MAAIKVCCTSAHPFGGVAHTDRWNPSIFLLISQNNKQAIISPTPHTHKPGKGHAVMPACVPTEDELILLAQATNNIPTDFTHVQLMKSFWFQYEEFGQFGGLKKNFAQSHYQNRYSYAYIYSAFQTRSSKCWWIETKRLIGCICNDEKESNANNIIFITYKRKRRKSHLSLLFG